MATDLTEVEIPFAATDGVPLAGDLFLPGSATEKPVVIIVHGVGGNRQSPRSIEWARGLARRGYPAFVIDTRGHDWDWRHAGRSYGAGHERLDESPHDLAGAVQALRDRGFTRFILAGQSLGTVKTAYTQATAPIDGVVGLVLRSGPRFSPIELATRYDDKFGQTVAAAEAKQAAEGPDAMIEVEVPLPGRYAVAAYLEKYGPHGRFDWLRLLDCIAGPKLILLGGADPLPLVIAAREAVQGWPSPPPGCEVHIVPGADHGFSEHADLSAELTARWAAGIGI